MFPPEIIDHILSFLQWDRETLKVCARAHPSLSSLVKKHFYRHFTVQNFDPCPAGAYSPSDLLKLFVNEPNIANHVRSLRMHVHFSRDYHAWESILPMVTQLRVIVLSSITKAVWDKLHESFRTAFTNCLRLPTLTDVNLSNINRFPLSALDHSTSLRGLSLALEGDFSYLPPSSPLVYPPLDFLDLCRCSSSSMEIITSWVESRSLPVRSLKLGSYLNQRLLGGCANTLTTLSLVFWVHYYTDIPLSLSCLPHLAQLTVRSSIFLDGSFSSCLPAVMRFLDTLPSPPTSLVLLIISLNIFIGDDTDIPDIDWSPLISFPYFDTIPSIELRVKAPNSPPETPLVELLKQDRHLKQLERHRSFVIKAEDQDCSS